MPELPEVETIVRGLARDVRGLRIEAVTVLRPDLIEGEAGEFERGAARARIGTVERRAKNIVFHLEENAPDDRLIVNLGMTGRLLVMDPASEEPAHLGVRFQLEGGRVLLYQDVRRFGRLQLLSSEAWEARSSALGYEPLDAAFTPTALYELARSSRVAIKSWLMDQRRVVGVGNIYASEALFRARISPRKAARRLTRAEATRLHQAIVEVLTEAIEFRGTTLLDYRDSAGEKGDFSRRLRVYGREGEPCVVCGSPIVRIVQGGRSTFYCRVCQRSR